MMTFFYSTQSSSVPCLIALEEAGIECQLIETSALRNVMIDELRKYNSIAKVGTLVFEDGTVLTQNGAILEYFADLSPSSRLLPPAGTIQRNLVMSWLFLSVSDIQKTMGPATLRKTILSAEVAQDEFFHFSAKRLSEYISLVESQASKTKYISGNEFTIADCHLAFTLEYTQKLLDGFDKFPHTKRYFQELMERPSVQRAREIEGNRMSSSQ